MSSTVPSRWKILIAIAVTVTIVDQWTKFLVVKHLTPGIAQAQLDTRRPITQAEQDKALEESGFFRQLGLFYGVTKGPCRTIGAHCPTVQVIDGFWNWRYVENPGAAWGLMSGVSDSVRVPFFILVSLLAIGFIIAYFRKLEDSQLLLVLSLSLVFGGAIGNFIDRLHLSYVVDFIDWYVGTSHWPTFNFADSAITTGVALICVEWIRDARRSKETESGKNPKEKSSAKGRAE